MVKYINNQRITEHRRFAPVQNHDQKAMDRTSQ